MSSLDSPIADARHWQFQQDEAGTGWLCFDRVGASANTLSTTTMVELAVMLESLASKTLRGLVVHSGKATGFIAGADVHEFPKLNSAELAYTATRQGQQVMDRLEVLPYPTVAVLNGFALGGGLELALACTRRIAFEGHEPVFGLPEVQLGVHPGFGGTVRLPRLIGVRKAMELMLTGRSLRPRDALDVGLVDELCTSENWREVAVRQLRQPGLGRRSPSLPDRLLGSNLLRPLMARKLRERTSEKASPEHYPAPFALIDLWQDHGGDTATEASEAEARSFAELVITPASRNLVRVYFLQERLKKVAGGKSSVARVHVVGAGVMGGDIAAWCALRGLEVTLQDRDMRYIEPALIRGRTLFERRLRQPALVEAAVGRLRADPEGAGVAGADLVIEAVFEDLAVKQAVYARLEPDLRPGAILATNTSSIPLESLGECLKDPGRLVGLHFFNPVAKLPLVEVVAARLTSPEAMGAASAFARRIGKLPVPCRSNPGFLVNRILAPYMGEAMELVREGMPLAEIDLAATDFGMPVGPVELADTVGLDVADHVARILAPVLHREPAAELAGLVKAGHLGVKSGQGFYTYRDRKPVRARLEPGSSSPAVRDRLVYALLNEAAACLHEGIVSDADLVDAGVIFGTGFAPFRGGPLQYARDLGIDAVEARLRELAGRHGARFNPSAGWSQLRN